MDLFDLSIHRDMMKRMIAHLEQKGVSLVSNPSRTIQDIVEISVKLNVARNALCITQYQINRLLTPGVQE